MNTKRSEPNVSKELPKFDKKEVKPMISRIDRKRIFIFIAIAYGIVIAGALMYIFTGGNISNFQPGPILMLAIGFSPAIANVVTRLITREGWSNTFLRLNLRRGWPYYLAAWTLPLLAIILGGAIYYLLFPGKFDLSMQWARTALIPPQFAKESWTGAISGTIIDGYRTVLIAMFLFLGEEFGWRAYLLPKLMPIGPRKAVLLTGVIWSAWHWPMIIMGFNYGIGYWGAPVSALLVFTLVILPMSILISWMTLRTGSVWPACIAHAENNLFCYLMVLFILGKPDLLIGPSNEGIVGCLGYVLLALPVFLSLRALAPVDRAVSKKSRAVEKAADRAIPGTVS
jgi:membrane protease YdiL (CAAX protease family)